MTTFNKTNVSKQSNAQRMTPNKKKSTKVVGIKDNKEMKDVKTTKIPKANALKPAPSIPFKGITKLAQYSYNKSTSNRNVDLKPIKPTGVSKFVVELSGSKQ